MDNTDELAIRIVNYVREIMGNNIIHNGYQRHKSHITFNLEWKEKGVLQNFSIRIERLNDDNTTLEYRFNKIINYMKDHRVPI